MAMAEAPWPCPDPQCSGFLDRRKSKRVSIDPHTGKEVGLVLTWGWVRFYRDPLSGIGFVLAFLLWIGIGYLIRAFFPGKAIQSPLATFFGAIGFVAGLVVYIAIFEISAKRRKAALARAVSYVYYRCPCCLRWGLSPDQVPSEERAEDGSRNAEGSRSA